MSFKEKGYHVVKNFLDKDFTYFIQDYFFLRIKAGHADTNDKQAPFSYSFYSDPFMETILEASIEPLSEISEFKLLPTYTYSRLYGVGDELVNHRDRPSCEMSATLALGIPEGESINPIYFSKNEDKSDPVEVLLEPGDLCLYRGCDLYHWRPPFTQKWYLQAFLHYVNADGPYADHIYDKRPYLGMSSEHRLSCVQ